MGDYTSGDQPCEAFEPKRNGMSIRKEHQCPRCDGTRCECVNCDKDHHEGGWDKCELTALRTALKVAVDALERISRSHDCGCRPCTGQCLSPTALQITVETMRDIANTALTASTARVGELEAFVFQVAHSQTNGDPALVATQILAALNPPRKEGT